MVSLGPLDGREFLCEVEHLAPNMWGNRKYEARLYLADADTDGRVLLWSGKYDRRQDAVLYVTYEMEARRCSPPKPEIVYSRRFSATPTPE